MKLSSAGVIGYSMSRWFEALANDTVKNPQRKRSVILLWMVGGPSQMDTFDLKPGHANGGPYKEIHTNVPGIKIGEHLPKLARHLDKMAILRSMSTKENEHERATFYLRTGYQPLGPVQYPPLGSLVAHERGDASAGLPSFISIAPFTRVSPASFSSGFLPPQYAPLIVGNGNPFRQSSNYEQALKVQDLARPTEVSDTQAEARLELLKRMQKDFGDSHPGVISNQTAYERAVRLMRTAAAKAFELSEEKEALRDAYGRSLFGQGCLLARRLVERGVSFVEVALNDVPGALAGWDTHQQNFDMVRRLCHVLDPAWSTLLADLKDHGLLETTLVIWMGEFGRTPRINQDSGRDHFATAWSTVLAGGGIKGGQVYGKTTPDGTKVEENPVSVPNFMCTIVKALGIDPTKQNMSNVGRPIRIADAGSKALEEVLA
jgi:hypothetical protein